MCVGIGTKDVKGLRVFNSDSFTSQVVDRKPIPWCPESVVSAWPLGSVYELWSKLPKGGYIGDYRRD